MDEPTTTDKTMNTERADTDDALSRRGWGKGMLLGASALAVLFAGKPTETLAAPPTDTWKLGGNTGVDTTNFLGPTNSAPLIFKTAGVERMRIAASGNIGIGNTSPSFARMVVDVANGVALWARHTATTGDAPAIRAESAANVANASAVQGILTNGNAGDYAAAVRGDVRSSISYRSIGVLGRHAGSGYGMYAESLGTSGGGLYAEGGEYGISAKARGTFSSGIIATGPYSGMTCSATATNGSTFGVHAVANSSGGGNGIYGRGGSSTGVNIGVHGETYSTDGFGGYFHNSATGQYGTGVVGLGSGTPSNLAPVDLWAAGGEFSGPNGVIGVANDSSGFGVIGIQGSGYYAGFFRGNVDVQGTLSKTTGSFKIDHPLDPANKYLYHSFVESPDMMNVYNGNVVLDARGEATVELPTYFEALNRDFRYQLTAIGAPGPNLHIAKEISGNRFTIAGGTRGMRVSWQVTGIRQDAYAKAHPVPVEVDKPAHERGTYLTPEEHHQPASKRVGKQTQRQGARPTPPPVPRDQPRPSQPAAPSGE